MNKENYIEMVEIWRPVDEGGEVVVRKEGGVMQNMKQVAIIVGQEVIRLEDGIIAERTWLTKEEAANVLRRAR